MTNNRSHSFKRTTQTQTGDSDQLEPSGASSSAMESIATLLTKAIVNPKQLRSKDGSDALVLCLHCLLVEAGFESHGKRIGKSPDYYPPPQDWRQLENEWIISYTRCGAKNTFRLHCSLQTTTARLFIHASECIEGVPRRENIQVLGLQLSNYTDAQRCESASWQGSYSFDIEFNICCVQYCSSSSYLQHWYGNIGITCSSLL
jgi:hypothetical protein